MNNQSTLKMLLTFYNSVTGARYRSPREEAFTVILKEDASNTKDIRAAIVEWKNVKPEDAGLEQFCDWYRFDRASSFELSPPPVPAQSQEQSPAISELQLGMTLLSQTVAKMVAEMKTSEIQQTVISDIGAKVDSYIAENYGRVEKTVTLISEFGKREVKGVQHTKFDSVLKFVANDEPVYLSGPAGSGKNVMCKQIADALGLEFFFTNAVTQEYKLTGFTDANGTFHESQFYKAFKNGGLFMLDEMDASIPEVLIILNAAIANRYFDFPAPVGKVEAHPNFRVIAAGNTLGHGADSEYVGRNTLDAASLDRFAVIRVDYDERIETNVANGNTELVSFCRSFRKATEKAGLQVIVSYRAIGRMAKMITMLPVDEVLESCLIKGLERDDLKAIQSNVQGHGQYTEAFEKILRERA